MRHKIIYGSIDVSEQYGDNNFDGYSPAVLKAMMDKESREKEDLINSLNRNSDIEAATKFEMDRRARIIKNSNSSLAIQQHVQEFALCPSEAFLTVSSNIFPTIELRNQLNKVEAHNLNLIKND